MLGMSLVLLRCSKISPGSMSLVLALALALAACGGDDGAGEPVDGEVGAACAADGDCNSGACECGDAQCSARTCAVAACDCQAGPDCQIPLADGVEDENSCRDGAACYQGTCYTLADEVAAPVPPATIDTLTVLVGTRDEDGGDTSDEVQLCLTETDCFSLTRERGEFLERGMMDTYQFDDLDLARTDVDRVQLAMIGTDDWNPACLALRFDGEPVHCIAGLDFRIGDNSSSFQEWSDPDGLHIDCASCFAQPLLDGPMLGAIESDRARVWIRTDTAHKVELLLATDPAVLADSNAAAAVVARAYADAERDYATVLIARGLQPQTTYYYAVDIAGTRFFEPTWTFTTPMARGERGAFRFAFGSCVQIPDHDPRIFDPISRSDPDFFMFVGDSHYGNAYRDNDLRFFYREAARVPERAAMAVHTPIIATWDDHDFLGNNTNGTDPARMSALRVFNEYWANPSVGENGEGVYFEYSYGDVDFFVLDTRFFRDPLPPEPPVFGDPLENSSLLGRQQTEWLLARLRESTATFKFVVSSSQFHAKGKDDAWASYLDARDVIFEDIANQGIAGVVLLSGDAHRTEIHRLPRPAGYDLYEITSSALANDPSMCRDRETELTCHDASYNVIEISVDTTAADPTLSAVVLELQGDELGEVFRVDVTRSQLEAP